MPMARRWAGRSRPGGSTTSCSTQVVGRVLRIKFALGLFEGPYVVPPTERGFDPWPPTRREVRHVLARALAGAGRVNDGVLPLPPRRAAWPSSADRGQRPETSLGDYSHLVHLETLSEARRRQPPSASSRRRRSSPSRTSWPGDRRCSRSCAPARRPPRSSYARESASTRGTDADIAGGGGAGARRRRGNRRCWPSDRA